MASFFDLDGLAEAVTDNEFTLREEVSLLINEMRSDDPKIRLAAQKQWHTLKKDILKANGLLGTARAVETTVTDDGRTVRRSASVHTLLTRTLQQQVTRHDPHNPHPSCTFLEPRDPSTSRPDPTPDPDPAPGPDPTPDPDIVTTNRGSAWRRANLHQAAASARDADRTNPPRRDRLDPDEAVA